MGRAIPSKLKRSVERANLRTRQLCAGQVRFNDMCGRLAYPCYVSKENVSTLISHMTGLSGASPDELRAYAGLEDDFEDIC